MIEILGNKYLKNNKKMAIIPNKKYKIGNYCMTRAELAKKIGKDVKTLNNWEKNNPELVKLINQGLALDEQIEEARRNLQRLEEIKEMANSGKFQLK
ncbi:hypothetical protein SUSP_000693 [Sulfurospirillum sp. 'SP']|nr:hypothetical protein [Sulfurospirillum sp. 'SP']WNY98275.1 hypothetical protein SUSP_000693 [Sulfurospirillum sp. 'SP']